MTYASPRVEISKANALLGDALTKDDRHPPTERLPRPHQTGIAVSNVNKSRCAARTTFQGKQQSTYGNLANPVPTNARGSTMFANGT